MRKYLVLLSVLLLAGASGYELLVNGDFEQPLATGWTHTVDGSGTHTADRQTGYDPDPDYEANTYQYDNPGWSRLGQVAMCPGVDLELSFRAKFEFAGGSSSCWPAACFSVCYLDAGDQLLGETRYFYSTYATWVPSATLSLIDITTPDWTDYVLDIADEIAQNLPGVNAEEVAKIEVALYSYTYSG